jgi:hypothetical protein
MISCTEHCRIFKLAYCTARFILPLYLNPPAVPSPRFFLSRAHTIRASKYGLYQLKYGFFYSCICSLLPLPKNQYGGPLLDASFLVSRSLLDSGLPVFACNCGRPRRASLTTHRQPGLGGCGHQDDLRHCRVIPLLYDQSVFGNQPHAAARRHSKYSLLDRIPFPH